MEQLLRDGRAEDQLLVQLRGTRGAGFADYGFAELMNTSTDEVISLFTARTKWDNRTGL